MNISIFLALLLSEIITFVTFKIQTINATWTLKMSEGRRKSLRKVAKGMLKKDSFSYTAAKSLTALRN